MAVKLTPRLVRRTLIPASYTILLIGLAISASIFFHGRPFDPKAAVLSNLESFSENPRGYLALAYGLAITGLLLLPATSVFYREIRPKNRALTIIGTILLVLGLLAAMTMGALSPFTEEYSEAHIRLAYTAFSGVCAGTLFLLAAARVAHGLVAFQAAALLSLGYIFTWPGLLSDTRLLRSLAFWEWILLVDCGVVLWVLARAVDSKSEP